jgi:hypothetical protein
MQCGRWSDAVTSWSPAVRHWRGRGTRCHRGLVKALPRVSTGPWSAPLRGRHAPCHRCLVQACPRMRAEAWQGRSPRRQPRRPLLSTAGVAAVMAWWGILQASVVQIRHRSEMGAACHQPSCSLRSPPAATVMVCSVSGSAALHRPLGPPQPVQLRCQRPGAVLQILEVAVAVERPPIGAAGPAAPIAGLRGARTSVVRLGPAAATASLVDPRARREGDVPGPTSLPAAHQVSPPLACLPGSDQPATRAGTAKAEPHRVPPYSRRSLRAVLTRGSGLKAGPDEAGGVSNPGPAAAGSLVSCWPAQAGPGGAGVCPDLGRSRSICSAALTGSWSSRCAPVRVASSGVAPAPPTASVV